MEALEWIWASKAAIMAALLATYAAARLWVAITPTTKDDKALEKLNPILQKLAKLFGIDPTQGRQE